MNISPGGAFAFTFFTQNSAGAPAAADSLPGAFLIKNAAKDTAQPVTVALDPDNTGMYTASGTTPATYTTGTVVQVIAKVTLGGQVSYIVAGQFVVTSRLGRFSFNATTKNYQPLEDDGVTPLGGTAQALPLTIDSGGNIVGK